MIQRCHVLRQKCAVSKCLHPAPVGPIVACFFLLQFPMCAFTYRVAAVLRLRRMWSRACLVQRLPPHLQCDAPPEHPPVKQSLNLTLGTAATFDLNETSNQQSSRKEPICALPLACFSMPQSIPQRWLKNEHSDN